MYEKLLETLSTCTIDLMKSFKQIDRMGKLFFYHYKMITKLLLSIMV